MMASILISSVLGALFLADTTLSLQVSSNSPCASLCLDSPSQNVTGSTTSKTSESDITCADSDYATSPVGQRFISCVSCLQTSTASDVYGSDQEWFLYNLQYAVDSCLFGFEDSSNPVSTSCSTDETCGPLQTALESGNLSISTDSEFSYCSANNDAFFGSSFSKCKECLTGSSNEKYLSNFLTALQAGCTQKPPVGTILAIEGSLFSGTPINITSPVSNSTATGTPILTPSPHKKGLTQVGIIGITVALVVLLMITIAVIFVCYRKHYNVNRMKQLRSPLDSRFGAKNITSPTNGSYGNPYSNPPVSVKEPFDPLLDNSMTALQKPHSSPREMEEAGWLDAHAHLASLPTPKSGGSIPTHQAYIPSAPSPASLSGSSDTYQISSSRASPKNIPPPIKILHPKQSSPWHFQISPDQQPQESQQVQQMESEVAQYSPPRIFPSATPPSVEYHPLSGNSGPPVIERPPSRPQGTSKSPEFCPPPRTQASNKSPEFRPPSRTQASNKSPEFRPPSRTQASNKSPEFRPPSRTAAANKSPEYYARPRIQGAHVSPDFYAPPKSQTVPLPQYSPPQYSPPSRAGSRTENRPRGESRTRGFPSPDSESSRIYPPGPHSQLPALETQHPSRSISRTESWRRATGRTGNANASVEVPIQISGPMIKHGGRFDFELAEREKMENDRKGGNTEETKKPKKEEATPISAQSEEQWPGSY